MRCLIQRVANAHVSVDGVVVGQVAAGMCLLVGINHDDDVATDKAEYRQIAFRYSVKFITGAGVESYCCR